MGVPLPNNEVKVVITGMGAVSCLGWGVDAMWNGLVRGQCGIGPLTKVNPEPHRIKHAGQVPPLQGGVSHHDPAVQFLVHACTEALGQAHLDSSLMPAVGLVLGTNFGAMQATERMFARSAAREDSNAAGMFADVATDLVAVHLGLGGTRSTISLSCASGNAAIGYAADLIRSGQASVVVAGGYDAISEVVWAGLSSLRAMSATAVLPFDKRRDGTIFSEGAGVVVLESEESALTRGVRPLARFLGYATSSNAFHMTHPDADGAGMARAMRSALHDAGLMPEDIDHINAHGTGTPSNDRLETMAIKAVFGPRACTIPINGIKSMLGHAMGAASALEAIATVMTVREGLIPPTIGLEQPDPDCDLDYTPLKARKATVRTALKNSAGFGGCNASVILGGWG